MGRATPTTARAPGSPKPPKESGGTAPPPPFTGGRWAPENRELKGQKKRGGREERRGDSVRAANGRDQEPVRPTSVERLEPRQAVLDGEWMLVERGDAAADVVVVELENRFEIGASSNPDLHGRDDTTSVHASDGAQPPFASHRHGSGGGRWAGTRVRLVPVPSRWRLLMVFSSWWKWQSGARF